MMKPTEEMRAILDLARWAPSGDNVQGWQFEITGERTLTIYFEDTRHHAVYDLKGQASQLSFGCLLETLAIAASGHGLRAEFSRRSLPSEEDWRPIVDVVLLPDPGVLRDPLIDAIKTRAVQRRAMRTRPLSAADTAELKTAIGEYELVIHERFGARFAAARLMYKNAKLRLTMPEAFEVHRSIIAWGCERSDTLVPDKALGVDAATLVLMKWAMASWSRMSKVNALLGTWAARLQMDLIPGLACGAHLVLKAPKQPQSFDEFVAAGRAIQRLWLALTLRGWYLQPEMTPLIFARYMEDGTRFTTKESLYPLAHRLHADTMQLLGKDGLKAVFIGRVGAGPAPSARSERKPLDQLWRR